MRTISVCIPNYDRFEMLFESFAQVYENDNVSEIVIVDDASDYQIYQKIKDKAKQFPKIKLYRNKNNVDCYRNKRTAISYAENEWLIILDSDNIISFDYLVRLFQIMPWKEDTAYMPSFAEPTFSYKEFSGLIVTKENVAEWMDIPMFSTMLNCMNYFVNRDQYLKVWDSSVNPHTADSIYQNYRWLNAGNKIYVVPELTYFHRIHDGSHYVLNNHKTGDFYRETEYKIRSLK